MGKYEVKGTNAKNQTFTENMTLEKNKEKTVNILFKKSLTNIKRVSNILFGVGLPVGLRGIVFTITGIAFIAESIPLF